MNRSRLRHTLGLLALTISAVLGFTPVTVGAAAPNGSWVSARFVPLRYCLQRERMQFLFSQERMPADGEAGQLFVVSQLYHAAPAVVAKRLRPRLLAMSAMAGIACAFLGSTKRT